MLFLYLMSESKMSIKHFQLLQFSIEDWEESNKLLQGAMNSRRRRLSSYDTFIPTVTFILKQQLLSYGFSMRYVYYFIISRNKKNEKHCVTAFLSISKRISLSNDRLSSYDFFLFTISENTITSILLL